MHLYSTCMENVSWSSKAGKHKTKPSGFQGEEGEGGCCALETPRFISRRCLTAFFAIGLTSTPLQQSMNSSTWMLK